MSKNKAASRDPGTKTPGLSRTGYLAIGIIVVLVLAVIAGLFIFKQGPWAPAKGAVAANSSGNFSAAGALYNDSVDLAYAGKYQEALDKTDAALALNESSWTSLLQSNRAGILVELGRYDEAVAAADAAISVQGNLTSAHAIAWYNKGNALTALNRTAEANAAYANATALDPTLKHP